MNRCPDCGWDGVGCECSGPVSVEFDDPQQAKQLLEYEAEKGIDRRSYPSYAPLDGRNNAHGWNLEEDDGPESQEDDEDDRAPGSREAWERMHQENERRRQEEDQAWANLAVLMSAERRTNKFRE